MNINAKPGEQIHQTWHKQWTMVVKRGNDIYEDSIFGRRTLQTVVIEVETGEKKGYSCFVIKPPLWLKSRVTEKRVQDAVKEMEQELDSREELKT